MYLAYNKTLHAVLDQLPPLKGHFMKRILLADDEAIITMQLEKRLASMGYEVVGIASSGKESLHMARELKPDLVLMDIVMPGDMDGIDAASMIRSELDIPIVFLTAFADGVHIDRAKRAEPFGYIVKPFHEEEIFASIEVALHKRMLEQRFRDKEKLYRAIMERAFDPICVIDRNCRVMDVNERAARLLGHERNDLIGKEADKLLAGGDPARFFKFFEDMCTNGSGTLRNMTLTARKGSQVRADLSGSAIEYAGDCAVLLTLNAHFPRRNRRKRLGTLLKRYPWEADSQVTLSRAWAEKPGMRADELSATQGKWLGVDGMVQLCTSCKKVKTTTGAWIRLESYFKNRYGLVFSHGICSECAHKLWPDMPPDFGAGADT